jgi:hypothetical protein
MCGPATSQVNGRYEIRQGARRPQTTASSTVTAEGNAELSLPRNTINQGRVISSHLTAARAGLATRRSDRGTFTPKDGRLANKRDDHNYRVRIAGSRHWPQTPKNPKRTANSPQPTYAVRTRMGERHR